MTHSTFITFAWKVWRITSGKAHIEKVAVAKQTKTYTWAVVPHFLNTPYALSIKNRFDKNGCGNYSQEPCLERLFFSESEAFAYARFLNKNQKAYYHGSDQWNK